MKKTILCVLSGLAISMSCAAQQVGAVNSDGASPLRNTSSQLIIDNQKVDLGPFAIPTMDITPIVTNNYGVDAKITVTIIDDFDDYQIHPYYKVTLLVKENETVTFPTWYLSVPSAVFSNQGFGILFTNEENKICDGITVAPWNQVYPEAHIPKIGWHQCSVSPWFIDYYIMDFNVNQIWNGKWYDRHLAESRGSVHCYIQ